MEFKAEAMQNFKTQMIFIGLGFCLLFFAMFSLSADATQIYDNGFETYSDEYSINNIGVWSSSASGAKVDSAEYSSGAYSLRSKTNAEDAIYIGSSTFKTVSGRIMVKSFTYGNGVWTARQTASTTATAQVQVLTTGEVRFCAKTTCYHLATTTAGTWNDLRIINDNGYVSASADLLYYSPPVYIGINYFDRFQQTPGTSNTSNPGIFFDNMVLYDTGDLLTDEDLGSVEVITLPDMGEVSIQVGSAEFNYIKDTYCYVGQTNCAIKYYYTYENIGAMLVLYYLNEEHVKDWVDIVADLPDVNQLKGEFVIASTSATVQNIDYQMFLYPDDLSTASATLYNDLTVHWISSSTDDITGAGIIGQYFSNLFPISIFLQLKNIIENNESNPEKFVLSVDDLVDDSYKGAIGTAPLLSADILEQGTVWQTKIYPFMDYILWIMTMLVIVFRIRSVISSDDQSI